MLTHDAVIWQYVSCIVDAEIAAVDMILHALPMYHCAQLDVFLGPAIYLGATNVIAPAPTPESCCPSSPAPHHVVLRSADGLDRLLRSPLFDRPDLSRFARATTAPRSCLSRCCGRFAPRPEAAALEPLWPDGNRPAGHHARSPTTSCASRVMRPARDERGDARRRRPDERRHAWRSRRDRASLAAAALGLLPRRPGQDRARLRGRLVPLRRSRDDRRRRRHHRRRPQEGHDQDRRRERGEPRGRRGDLPAAAGV